jgi:flagellar biosynthetic protein FlhB
MSAEEEGADKPHDPTAVRLEQARKQGDVAKSTDLLTAAVFLAFLIVAALSGPVILDGASQARQFLHQAPAIARAGAMAESAFALFRAAALPLLLVLLVPAAAALLALVAQKGLVFAPARLRPRLSRISPLATARQKFGAEGLFEFAKSLVKLCLIGAALALMFQAEGPDILGAALLAPAQGAVLMLWLTGLLLAVSAAIAAVIGVGDLFWQRHALMRRNRMSRREFQDELRQEEGDPQAKATRRQRGQDMALNQMLAQVPTASVVIVNPTHYAVALFWQRGSGGVPVVVAKGVDDVALKIREAARAAAVPIHSDPPTARAIHASIRIGQPIDRRHYKAVAAALRFAERLRTRGREMRDARP